MRIRFVALLFSAFALVSIAAPAPNSVSHGDQVLIILIRPGTDIPSTPEDLLNQLATSALKNQVSARLGNPVAVRALTQDRLPSADRLQLPANDPKRLLDSYVVLTYSSATAASAAKQQLAQDPSISFVQSSRTYRFSSTPNDPLFPYVSGVTKTLDAQWGMRALNLESAWDYVTGTAYVAALDNGVLESHPDLQKNYRSHFSSNFVVGCGTQVDETSCGGFSYAGHGTHVSGIIAASSNNSTGVSGVCWTCSLWMGRIGYGGSIQDESWIVNAINGMVSRGVQVINMSFGTATAQAPNCDTNPNEAYCVAINFAASREVTVVAASGNNKTSQNFPASRAPVIGVGGIQVGGALWDQQVSLADSPARINASDEIGTNYGNNQTVVAPARDVLSTFYTGLDWVADTRCGSATSFTSSFISGGTAPGFSYTLSYGRQYGICTGTSMAAPHVAGIVALLRTANPLLTAPSIRTQLTSYASHAASPDSNWGYGIPNAAASAQAVLSTNSRITPLFALYNESIDDYLLTVVPQMGTAAILNGMWPQPGGGPTAFYTYSWLGSYTTGYSSFPASAFPVPKFPLTTDNLKPRARLRVFTTPKDSNGTALYPVYRFSYVDTTPGSFVARHVYAIGDTDRANTINEAIWKFDGVEGYIYPPNISQPSGTYPIYRWVKPASTSYILFPDGDQSLWTGRGFQSDGSGVLGYAYVN